MVTPEELIVTEPIETQPEESTQSGPIIATEIEQWDPIVEIKDDTSFDPRTQKIIEESIYTNNTVQKRTRIVDKDPSELIADTIMSLKLKIAQWTATEHDREDLRLLTA